MIRIQVHRRLQPDDFMLLFACVALIAANVILYYMLSDLYWDEELLLNPHWASVASTLTTEQLIDMVLLTRKTILSYVALSYTSIYGVKLCFLFFFRQLIDRVKRLVVIWKISLGFTVVSYCVTVSSYFMTCTHYDYRVGKSPWPSVICWI